MNKPHGLLRNHWTTKAGAIFGLAVLAGATGFSANAATSKGSHQAGGVARPESAAAHSRAFVPANNTVTAFHQEFTDNTQYFCPSGTGNVACDGVENDYGTIDWVPAGFSNGGGDNYAPSTPALSGGWYALVSGTSDDNEGQGCPQLTATEYCSGPYALFGSGAYAGAYSHFPSHGFTVTDDLYLSPTTAPAVTGNLIDDDVEINTNSGGYGIDNIITACAVDGDSFVINFGHNSPGPCSGTPQVTTDGWYRFVFDFSNVSGFAYVTMSVYSESGLDLVATSSPQPVGGGSAEPVADWGGPGYFWLPTEDISGVPMTNFALQLGDHAKGYSPTTTTS